MRIQSKVRQHRRDFTAVYVCEHCGATKTDSGYDDAYFHQTVIPGMRCEACRLTGSAPTSAPDVPEGVVL